MAVMEAPTVVVYSVRPVARVHADPNDERFDRLLDALLADPRALGASSITNGDDGEVSTIFQVAPSFPLLSGLDTAAILARHVFEDALAIAGFAAHVSAISVVEGDDPDQLP